MVRSRKAVCVWGGAEWGRVTLRPYLLFQSVCLRFYQQSNRLRIERNAMEAIALCASVLDLSENYHTQHGVIRKAHALKKSAATQRSATETRGAREINFLKINEDL